MCAHLLDPVKLSRCGTPRCLGRRTWLWRFVEESSHTPDNRLASETSSVDVALAERRPILDCALLLPRVRRTRECDARALSLIRTCAVVDFRSLASGPPAGTLRHRSCCDSGSRRTPPIRAEASGTWGSVGSALRTGSRNAFGRPDRMAANQSGRSEGHIEGSRPAEMGLNLEQSEFAALRSSCQRRKRNLEATRYR